MTQFDPMPYDNPLYPEQRPAGLAIASMVLGILALVTFCLWIVCGPLAIAGLILGIIAKVNVKAGTGGGSGMATAGITLSCLALVLTAVTTVLLIVYADDLQRWGEEQQRKAEQRRSGQSSAFPLHQYAELCGTYARHVLA